MIRKVACLAVLGMLTSSVAAQAQQLSPYGPRPLAPGQSVVPSLPTSLAPRPTMPVHTQDGPKTDAAEPYFILPESLPSGAAQSTPQPKNPTTMREAVADFFVPQEPSEPYTTYEGRRYAAEMRQDNVRYWAQVDYIHWWYRRVNTPPLVTTGNPANPNAGAIGQPDTRILIGDEPVGASEFNGIRGTFGWWFDCDRIEGIEIGGFWLGKNSRQYAAGSDAAGTPITAQPFQNPNTVPPTELAFPYTFPGASAGRIDVSNITNLFGAEVNFVRNILRVDGWTLDSLVGGRYLYLNDQLTQIANVTVLPGGAGGSTFLSVPQPAGANFLLTDSIDVTNRFYGGQIGARLSWAYCRFDMSAVGKVGFGASQHVANLGGATTLNVNGTSTTVAGGAINQRTNIGRFESTDFAFVPELNLSWGYLVTPRLRFVVGYNLLYWSRIQRAGTLVDRQVDLAQVPTSPTFNPNAPAIHPTFYGTRTDFWAQGINVGLEFKY